ncbi:hypothetical protein [Persephonella sp.]|uniref:hypothetical protein n=1 Tax=Persephonella sp. TaxID=2060922 RepID=UPI0026156A22|nr:hypothetical protein [Persephonella sp.]
MQILKVAGSQKLNHKVNSHTPKGDLFAQIFENMIKASSHLPKKLATVKNHHPSINLIPADKGINHLTNLKLLKKIPVKQLSKFKIDKIFFVKKYKPSTTEKINRFIVEPDNTTFPQINKTTFQKKKIEVKNPKNQPVNINPLINESNFVLQSTQRTSQGNIKAKELTARQIEKGNIAPNIKNLAKFHDRKNLTIIYTDNLQKTKNPKGIPVEISATRENIKNIFIPKDKHMPVNEEKVPVSSMKHGQKTVEKIELQKSSKTSKENIQNINISNQIKTTVEKIVSHKDRQIQFIPVKPDKISVISSGKKLSKSIGQKRLNKADKNIFDSPKLTSKNDWISKSTTQEPKISYKSERVVNHTKTLEIASYDKEKSTLKVSNLTEKVNIPQKLQQNTSQQTQFKIDNYYIQSKVKILDKNNYKPLNDFKTEQKLVISNKNKLRYLVGNKIKKVKVEQSDKAIKTSEQLNKTEKHEELIIENNPVQPLNIENPKDKPENTVKILVSQKETVTVSHSTQNDFKQDSFSDLDSGVHQHKAEYTQEEDIHEHYFQKQLSLNLRLENISLRATYHNGNLNLFMSVNGSQLLNSLKTEIPEIMKETGIKEYNLKIKSKEKEIRIFSKQKNYNTQSVSREINVRV